MRLPSEFVLVIGLIKAFKITPPFHFPAVFIDVKAISFFFKQGKFKRVYVSYENGCPQVIELIKGNIEKFILIQLKKVSVSHGQKTED